MNYKIFRFFLLTGFLLAAVSCSEDGTQSPGYEYMPDMYRSPAIEAYVDYPQDRVDDDDPDNRTNHFSARQPVEGTIAHTENASEADIYNRMPYPYENTNRDYERAGAELKNPLETGRYEEEGKEIYTKMCLHCHGEKGAGDGKVVTNGGHARPGAYDQALKNLSVGKMFHTLTYGKGMMGSHSSQLDKMERWKVIQYVQMLQNGGKSLFKGVMEEKEVVAEFDEEYLLEKKSINVNGILFESGSDAITDTSKQGVEKIVEFMNHLPDQKISIVGHTDNTGTEEENQELSENRAKSVYNYLINAGISADRITFSGKGQTDPAASNETEEGRQKNRRIEIQVVD